MMGLENPKTAEPVYSNREPASRNTVIPKSKLDEIRRLPSAKILFLRTKLEPQF